MLAPFRALRPAATGAALASRLAPPYDVIDERERLALVAQDPHNAVRLTLPRDTDGRPGSRYAAAAAVLSAWEREGALTRDSAAALYVYEEAEPGGHVQRGLLGALALVEDDAGIVLPHENTMAGPVADRLALLTATRTDLEPIFLVYDGGGGAASELVAAPEGFPLVAEATTGDGTRHRVWAVADPATLAGVAADLLPRRAVIADGHHRYATYRLHQAERHAAGDGPGGWDHGLTLLVDATAFGPQVHAIHRVLPGLPLAEAVAAAATGMRSARLPDLERAGDADAAVGATMEALAAAGAEGTAFVLSDGVAAHLLSSPDADRLTAALPDDRSPAWRGLDVTTAHRYLVGVLWGLADEENTVGFAHSPQEALAAASTAGGTALLLNPTPVGAVLAVAAAGERMPRKSTLFTPKPRSGLVLRPHAA